MKGRSLSFFGYSVADYQKMFNLDTSAVKAMNILDCGGCGNTFVMDMYQQVESIVGVDPLYELPLPEITKLINNATVDAEHERQAQRFLAEFELHLSAKRYQAASFTNLPFRNEAFDLVLCSHCLFLHDDEFTENFHINSILEMIRVADEVRIFPLVDLKGNISPYLGTVLQALQEYGLDTEIQAVDYELQKLSNATLIIDNKLCHVGLHRMKNS